MGVIFHYMQKKIKIVFSLPSFSIGGIQKHLVDQLKFFDRDKFAIFIIVLFDSKKENFYDMIPKDVAVYKFNFKGSLDFKNWLRLATVLREIKPDIVLSCMYSINKTFRILKLFFGYKSIIREDSTYTEKTLKHIWTDKFLSFLTYKIIAVSKEVADFTIKQEGIKKEKFVVIHNGVDTAAIDNFMSENSPDGLREELGFGKDDRIIINVARLLKERNHQLLVRAFCLFKKTHPKHRLVILGGGEMEEELKAEVKRLNLGKDVFVLGYRKDSYKFYAISDFFVSASSREGLSISYLEAMAFGLPLLATKTAGTDELLYNGENGYFIEGFDEEVIASAFEKMANSDLTAMGHKAREICQKFDIKKNVRRYESLFEDCMKDKHKLQNRH